MIEAEQTAPEAATAVAPKPQSWLDLLLYLLVGFGTFISLSALIGLAVMELSPGVSFLLFLANFICLGGTTYLMGVRRGKVSWEALGIRPFRWRWEWLLIGIGLSLLLMPARTVLGLVVQWLIEGNFR